jgi:hypothetical protein
MLRTLWNKLWNRDRALPGAKRRRTDRHLSYRPWLEPLEARELPALPGGGLIASTVLRPVSTLYQTGIQQPGGTTPIQVTVAENSPATVIDMGPVFAAIRGLQHQDGLRLSILGNTNSALVTAELSDSALTLTYVRDHYGSATVVVCATDADGVSVQQTLLVTVCPLTPAVVVGGGAKAAAVPLGIRH